MMSCGSGLKFDYLREVCDMATKSKCVVDVLAQPPVEFFAPSNSNNTMAASATGNASMVATLNVSDDKKKPKNTNKN